MNGTPRKKTQQSTLMSFFGTPKTKSTFPSSPSTGIGKEKEGGTEKTNIPRGSVQRQLSGFTNSSQPSLDDETLAQLESFDIQTPNSKAKRREMSHGTGSFMSGSAIKRMKSRKASSSSLSDLGFDEDEDLLKKIESIENSMEVKEEKKPQESSPLKGRRRGRGRDRDRGNKEAKPEIFESADSATESDGISSGDEFKPGADLGVSDDEFKMSCGSEDDEIVSALNKKGSRINKPAVTSGGRQKKVIDSDEEDMSLQNRVVKDIYITKNAVVRKGTGVGDELLKKFGNKEQDESIGGFGGGVAAASALSRPSFLNKNTIGKTPSLVPTLTNNSSLDGGPSNTSLLERVKAQKAAEKGDSFGSVFSRFKANDTSFKTNSANGGFAGRNEKLTEIDRKKHAFDKNKDRYAWLLDVKDRKGRKVGEPGYDPKSLYIPRDEWNRFTPFEKQYWEIKSNNWDSVVFFKKGKFYELYENDADIGHQLFDLKMTDRVNMRMVGVPEASFENWASQFVAKGFKVAKVEQMESSLAKTMRERDGTDLSTTSAETKQLLVNSGKEEKVVRRELTCILTAGTLVEPKMLSGDLSTYCLAIVESPNLLSDDKPGASLDHEFQSENKGISPFPSFGVAFVDTSTAKFYVVGIERDDPSRTQLETLLVQLSPREVVYVNSGAGPNSNAMLKNRGESDYGSSLSFSSTGSRNRSFQPSADGMGGLSTATWRVLKNTCRISTLWNALEPYYEFWDGAKTLENLKSEGYFQQDDDDMDVQLPTVLQGLENSSMGNLILSATGGLIYYLKTLKLDRELVPMGNFNLYKPLGNDLSLILDGSTLANLDVFTTENDLAVANARTSQPGTLFHLINHTRTPFGRRLLHTWLCHPLRDPALINERLDVVDFYLAKENQEFFDMLEQCFGKLPDIERLLSRVHAGTCKEEVWLRLLDTLIKMTRDFTEIKAIAHGLLASGGDSSGTRFPKKLESLLASFPLNEISGVLNDFNNSFDKKKAEIEKKLIPHLGNDETVDRILLELKKLDEWLDEHLEFHRKKYKCNTIIYKSIGKELHQLEIPRRIEVPPNYVRKSATKDVHRYYSPQLAQKINEQAEAMEHYNAALRNYKLVLYQRWTKHYGLFVSAVRIISEIDALLSLAKASESMGFDSSRPEIVDITLNGNQPFLEFRDLRHPCLTVSGGEYGSVSGRPSTFVPNDLLLGKLVNEHLPEHDDANVILLSGPNMGGKSTLIRQVCVAIILAQMGCYVPAAYGKMTVFDRIFTRLGARDSLLTGRSTFMVEMTETASFLKLATPMSFVAVDELGRGTSTHDGEAVAYSVLHQLSSRIGCISIFSTHYGLLANDICGTNNILHRSVSPRIRPMHMSCLVDPELRRVTFLYKLVNGVAERSHGMNVAHMAGIPLEVVKKAEMVAEEFEQKMLHLKATSNNHANSTSFGTAAAENELPLTVLSDFVNLLRVTDVEAKADTQDLSCDRVGGLLSHSTISRSSNQDKAILLKYGDESKKRKRKSESKSKFTSTTIHDEDDFVHSRPLKTKEVQIKADSSTSKTKANSWTNVNAVSKLKSSDSLRISDRANAMTTGNHASDEMKSTFSNDTEGRVITSSANDKEKHVGSSNQKRYGLLTADDLKKGADEELALLARKRESHAANSELGESSAPKTIYRDSKTGKVIDIEEEKIKYQEKLLAKEERKAKQKEWNMGLTQRREQVEYLKKLEEVKSTPFTSYLDDTKLKELKKNEVVWDDPMREYIQKSSKAKSKGSKYVYPAYSGPNPPPNRYGIKPGYRWDGVDRSNGFEEKYLKSRSKIESQKTDRYMHSVRDW
ncbi:DNA mismatch repair protein msh6 [Zancudomyces culisetae]|uniref:DNA mismatch repair protein msh6 n=1 Tax=Zancudomyces culisetae TaxID=1213189 RepID=A0A1R1PR29_ZANCU|nr:DNA mismatch repair protein msh6 [Zancudomyces culisetae]|eukprot:OMH83414.1 DNA mismatch repair protein msh6 [Zancudomyces culisetae]